MKKLILGILCLPILLIAQETPKKAWYREGKVGLQINQVSLSNWNAGGQNSLSGVTRFTYKFGYKTEATKWDNSINLAYGVQKLGEDQIQKMDDQIDFNSQLIKDFKGPWKYSGLLNFRTQFTDGFNYPNDSVAISTFLAPAYLIGSAGFEYKPNDNLRAMISPLTGKATFVMDDSLSAAGAFGLEAGENFRVELGAFIKFAYKTNLMENIEFETKLDLFSNYIENPQNIDVNWENYLNMKVNSLITVNIMTHLIYDDDIKIAYDDENPSLTGARTQFKQVLGVGLTYKF